MGDAEVFRKELFPRVDFGMNAPGCFFMEKLGEIMLNRLLGREGDYRMRLEGVDMFDKDTVLCEEDYFTRYYTELDGIQMSIIEAGAESIGRISSWFRPYCPFNESGIFDAIEEKALDFIEKHDLMTVAKTYLPDLSKEDFFALPGLCRDVYEVAEVDPLFEECDVGFFLLESPLIGEFLGCERIPGEIRRKVGKLILHIADPLDRGYFYTGMTRGVWRCAIMIGCPDCYEWVSANLLNANWLASVLLLKEKILTLDKIFDFLTEETRKGVLKNGTCKKPSVSEQDEVSRLCA